ncbi:hypothetical protein A3J19_02615 [Candidatus Daviesbacteria bacterium RIFCSPLOWO2_02_FULL_41_8]|uniref:DUF2283 domain-containing protein n=3 Tax=Candidatus Daviesiibacteriota TaxID=1752718 RepID=A0A1F5NLB8_9BACT|nr:MAG: hypothetical protein A2871_03415 [Candidatus Daviesbacteria bacterium RIFCSPHIGHO2_01_FULL_41_23]OGE32452.1 MAG: hypothetical protein A3D83_02255 [Candidatus Daviesbacteria bacterium RIFCSPHIGHO2_02_FULL_41_10]OGE61972.1 MAG: hypothetical protein A2967_03230 [Candidatus Daviesbacteria bacterium RIFCSPLOWO2_01_FULL_41_32]OGE78497.1 MAG: hypothetical protein A3J19_02615 [Candidatus Daviesbacteria bacterium RIFCSPLOWO2_02_FULL_41_8]
MKVTYDSKVDAMYIYLNPKKKGITRTEEMESGWIADYEGKKLIGIEILDASKVLGSKLGLRNADFDHTTAITHRIK